MKTGSKQNKQMSAQHNELRNQTTTNTTTDEPLSAAVGMFMQNLILPSATCSWVNIVINQSDLKNKFIILGL